MTTTATRTATLTFTLDEGRTILKALASHDRKLWDRVAETMRETLESSQVTAPLDVANVLAPLDMETEVD